ncbi:serine/arginine repetitive matrix protein 2-like [Hyalella azteca]|uniref:Serine/arginine repetitive matrix protein 2-like n=1 Tax=Hyalella azteca TaxID=294128 RepID=A0A8B7NXM8_HYAAZ|nr:serine/arginine repetitive matrix protein 2-like [Hyalella azteca]
MFSRRDAFEPPPLRSPSLHNLSELGRQQQQDSGQLYTKRVDPGVSNPARLLIPGPRELTDASHRNDDAPMSYSFEASARRDIEGPGRYDVETHGRHDVEALGRQDFEAPGRHDFVSPGRQNLEPPRQNEYEDPERNDFEAPKLLDIATSKLLYIATSKLLDTTKRRDFEASERRDFEASERRDFEASERHDFEAPGRCDFETPGCRDIEAPGRRDFHDYGRHEFEALGRSNVEEPGRCDFEAPGRRDLEAPECRDFEAPGRRDLEAPECLDFEAPGHRDFEVPGRRDFEAPGRRDFEAPGRRDFEAPGRRDFEAPGRRDFEVSGRNEFKTLGHGDLKANESNSATLEHDCGSPSGFGETRVQTRLSSREVTDSAPSRESYGKFSFKSNDLRGPSTRDRHSLGHGYAMTVSPDRWKNHELGSTLPMDSIPRTVNYGSLTKLEQQNSLDLQPSSKPDLKILMDRFSELGGLDNVLNAGLVTQDLASSFHKFITSQEPYSSTSLRNNDGRASNVRSVGDRLDSRIDDKFKSGVDTLSERLEVVTTNPRSHVNRFGDSGNLHESPNYDQHRSHPGMIVEESNQRKIRGSDYGLPHSNRLERQSRHMVACETENRAEFSSTVQERAEPVCELGRLTKRVDSAMKNIERRSTIHESSDGSARKDRTVNSEADTRQVKQNRISLPNELVSRLDGSKDVLPYATRGNNVLHKCVVNDYKHYETRLDNYHDETPNQREIYASPRSFEKPELSHGVHGLKNSSALHSSHCRDHFVRSTSTDNAFERNDSSNVRVSRSRATVRERLDKSDTTLERDTDSRKSSLQTNAAGEGSSHVNRRAALPLDSRSSPVPKDCSPSRIRNAPFNTKRSTSPDRHDRTIFSSRRVASFRSRSKSPAYIRSRSPVRKRSKSPLRVIGVSPRRLESKSPRRFYSKSSLRARNRSPLSHRNEPPRSLRNQSPLQLRSRSPLRLKSSIPLNLRSRSPLRSKSRSPLRLRSRSPLRSKSRSPLRLRSRSPLRLRSSSPLRLKSRSPLRLRSRSPLRLRSRSPLRLRRRSPLRVRSRSPLRVRSRSPLRLRSRSPLRLRSRSPLRLRSKSPLRLRSKSPLRLRSKSPLRLRSKSPLRLRRSPLRLRSRRSLRLRSRSPLRLRSTSPLRLRSTSPLRLKNQASLCLQKRSLHRPRSKSPLNRRSGLSPILRTLSPKLDSVAVMNTYDLSLARRLSPNISEFIVPRTPPDSSLQRLPAGSTRRPLLCASNSSYLAEKASLRLSRSPRRLPATRTSLHSSPRRSPLRLSPRRSDLHLSSRSSPLRLPPKSRIRSSSRRLTSRLSSTRHGRVSPSRLSPKRSPIRFSPTFRERKTSTSRLSPTVVNAQNPPRRRSPLTLSSRLEKKSSHLRTEELGSAHEHDRSQPSVPRPLPTHGRVHLRLSPRRSPRSSSLPRRATEFSQSGPGDRISDRLETDLRENRPTPHQMTVLQSEKEANSGVDPNKNNKKLDSRRTSQSQSVKEKSAETSRKKPVFDRLSARNDTESALRKDHNTANEGSKLRMTPSSASGNSFHVKDRLGDKEIISKRDEDKEQEPVRKATTMQPVATIQKSSATSTEKKLSPDGKNSSTQPKKPKGDQTNTLVPPKKKNFVPIVFSAKDFESDSSSKSNNAVSNKEIENKTESQSRKRSDLPRRRLGSDSHRRTLSTSQSRTVQNKRTPPRRNAARELGSRASGSARSASKKDLNHMSVSELREEIIKCDGDMRAALGTNCCQSLRLLLLQAKEAQVERKLRRLDAPRIDF